MVQIVHGGENTLKINSILEAAQRLFAQYGFEKTSMKDIAEDVGISKPSLYYYFPDKERLFEAVIDKEQHELIKLVEQSIEQSDNAGNILKQYISIRNQLFNQFLNLWKLRLNDETISNPMVQGILCQLKTREQSLISQILNIGIENNQFEIDNIEETAVLFMDILKGLRIFEHRKKMGWFLEAKEMESLEKKQLAFANIFIKGISKK